MINLDFKILKEKNLDKKTKLKIIKNIMSGIIFVEFKCEEPRLTLQKSFQNTMEGKKQSEVFGKSIKNTKQLKNYFGLDRE